jgi:predicted peptidase
MAFFTLQHEEHGDTFEFFVYLPDYFEELDSPPLIVFLHGSGERGYDASEALKGVGPAFEELQLPAVAIFPQCDPEYRAFYGAMETRVMSAIERVIEEFHVDRSRIYLSGYSMGGSSALWLAARHPSIFAGMISVAPGITWVGAEPPPHLPDAVRAPFEAMFVAANRTETIAKNIASVPTWFLQGTADEPCPIEETRSVIEEMRNIGCEPIVTEYDGMDHDSLEIALREEGLFEWLFKQQLSASRSKPPMNHAAD